MDKIINKQTEDTKQQKLDIIDTVHSQGWIQITKYIQQQLRRCEIELTRPKVTNAYNMRAEDEFYIWYNRGVILGLKYWLKMAEIVLRQRKRGDINFVQLMRGFYKGLKEPFNFVANTRNQIQQEKERNEYGEEEE